MQLKPPHFGFFLIYLLASLFFYFSDPEQRSSAFRRRLKCRKHCTFMDINNGFNRIIYKVLNAKPSQLTVACAMRVEALYNLNIASLLLIKV